MTSHFVRFLMIGVCLAALQACSSAPKDLKSPCAGANGSPCEHRPVNDWWRGPARS